MNTPLFRWIILCLPLIFLNACDLSEKPEKTFNLNTDGLFAASLSEHYALIATLNGAAELWQLKPSLLLHKWQHTDENNGIIAVAIAANEEYAITAERNSIAWWRIKDGTLLAVWSLPDIFSISLAKDGQHALVGLEDKAIYLKLSSGKTQYAFAHEDKVIATTLSDSGLYAASGSKDQTAKLWNLSSGEIKHIFQHDNEITTLKISHNDKYLLTNAALSKTRLWKIASGKVHKQLGPDRITLESAAFSSNDKYLLTGLVASRIELWTVKTGKQKKFWRAKKTNSWRPTASPVLAVNFVKKDKKFYSISGNGLLQRWRK